MRLMLAGGVSDIHRRFTERLKPYGHTVVHCVEARSTLGTVPENIDGVLLLYEICGHTITTVLRDVIKARELALNITIPVVRVSRKWAIAQGQLEAAGLIPAVHTITEDEPEAELKESTMDVSEKNVGQAVPVKLPHEVAQTAQLLVEAMREEPLEVTKIYFERRHDGQYDVQFEIVMPTGGSLVL